jgi:hypothetical protein
MFRFREPPLFYSVVLGLFLSVSLVVGVVWVFYHIFMALALYIG